MTNNSSFLLAAAAGAALLVSACEPKAPETPGFQGIIELEERSLGFELAGRLTGVEATRGQPVAAGQRLARLDDTLAKPARDARAAELRAARANVQLMRAGARPEDIRVAEAQLRAARERVTQLDRNLTQQRQLAAQGAAGTAIVSDLENDLARAREDVAALVQRVHLLRAGARAEELDAAEARVAGAEAALAAEDRRLERHTLVADRAGVVVDVHFEAGEIAAAGAPVVTVADQAHPFVDVFVPAHAVTEVALGDAAEVRVDGLGAALPGRVEDIARHTEFTPRYVFSPRERPHLVVRVRVRIDDPELRLRAGLPAFVVLP